MSDFLGPHGPSPPGYSVHGILQAIILEWVVVSYSRGFSLGIELGSPTLQADSLPSEPPGNLSHIAEYNKLLSFHTPICILLTGKFQVKKVRAYLFGIKS